MKRGKFMVIVGPDGVGKTTVARLTLEGFSGPTAYFHFRPPLEKDRLAESTPTKPSAQPDKLPPRDLWPLSVARIARSVVLFWLGYLRSVRPALRRGALVVGDRWAYGYLVQPRALRYFGPRWLAIRAVGYMPRPDLIVNLTAPAETIHARKQELTLEEARAELRAWAEIPFGPRLDLPNLESPRAAAREILAALDPS